MKKGLGKLWVGVVFLVGGFLYLVTLITDAFKSVLGGDLANTSASDSFADNESTNRFDVGSTEYFLEDE